VRPGPCRRARSIEPRRLAQPLFLAKMPRGTARLPPPLRAPT